MLNRKYLNKFHLKLKNYIDNSNWNEKEKSIRKIEIKSII